MEKPRLGQVLLSKNIITEDILEQALAQQQKEGSSGRKLATILVNDYSISHHAVFSSLAEIYAFRSITLVPSKLNSAKIKHTKDILTKIPTNFRKELLYHYVLPFQLQVGAQTILLVLTCDVTNKVIEKIPQMTEFKRYEVIYCPQDVLEELIQIVAPQKNEFLDLLNTAESNIVQQEEPVEEKVNDSIIDEEINKSVLVNLFEGALLEAVRKKASDIHIIPFQKNVVDIYFRIDSKLQLWHRQENTSPESFAAVVKDRTVGVDRFERDTAQDGFAQRTIDGNLIRYRVSIIPITSSEFEKRFESIVIRVIDDRNVVTAIKDLGFQERAESDIMKALSHSRGMVLVTGPTGSGKSTTLIAALYQIIDPTKNVLTVEDPVEFVIKGARQLKISNKMSFEQAIRVILRHDPDIVLVGEIRDKITADIAIKLSNTGHLTLSTLHTNDAAATISRLFKMGIEPFLLANVINIIIAQRLVRKLCPDCRIPLQPEHYEAALEFGITQAEIDSGKIFEAGKGCKKCNHGYKGRITICEALYFTPEVKRVVLEASEEIDEEKVKQVAQKQGFVTLKESGLHRIREGLSTIEEVIYATSED